MNPSTTALTLNMQLPNIATVSWAVQGDQLARRITATLVDGSTPWTPEASYHGVVRYHKPDGTSGVYDVDEEGNPAVTWSGNVATITIAQQTLTFPGTVLMQLEFYDSGSARITAFGWANNVQPSAVTDTEFLSTDYYNILTLQIAGVLGASGHPPYINSTSKNWMIWDENAGSYVDSGFSSIGMTGPAPAVTNTAYQYANSNSGTVTPTEWSNTRPEPTQGTWAWTKTVITFDNSNTTTLYSAAYQGLNGTGAVSTVNDQAPDANGNVTITAADIQTSNNITVDEEFASFARPNLLDNWYFVRGVAQDNVATLPINQRGQNSYTGAQYGIDRWIGGDANSFVGCNYNNYIVIRSSVAGSHNLLIQYFENKEIFAGKTVTISAIINGQLTQSTISVPADSSTWGSTIGAGSTPVNPTNGCAVYLRYLNSKLCFVFYVDNTYTANTNILLYAAKIEIGSTQTLAHLENGTWVLNEIPNYADQFAKCLRYYRRIGGTTNSYSLFYGIAFSSSQIRTHLDTPLGMAKAPTIAVSSIENFRLEGNGSAIVPTAIQVSSSITATQIPVYINAVNLEQYQVYAIVALASAYIELSAEL